MANREGSTTDVDGFLNSFFELHYNETPQNDNANAMSENTNQENTDGIEISMREMQTTQTNELSDNDDDPQDDQNSVSNESNLTSDDGNDNDEAIDKTQFRPTVSLHDQMNAGYNTNKDSEMSHSNRTARHHSTIGKTYKEYTQDRQIQAIQDNTILSQVLKHDSTAKRIRLCRFLFIGLLILAYFAFQLSKYLDANKNTISRSELTKIDKITAPYLVFTASSTDITPYFVYITVNDEFIWRNQMSLTRLFLTTDMAYNELDFTYDTDTVNWTLIELYEPNITSTDLYTLNTSDALSEWVLTSILIPPKDVYLEARESMTIGIVSFTDQYDTMDDSEDLYTQYIKSYALGRKYGIFWNADSRQRLVNKYLDDLIGNIMSAFGNSSQYTFTAQITTVYINPFETIDHSKSKKYDDELFYLCEVGSSITDVSLAVDSGVCDSYYNYSSNYTENGTLLNDSVVYKACRYPSLWSFLIFMPNPSGFKTTIYISQLRDLFDVLSNVGGLFSPLLTMSGIIILYMIWGLDIGVCRIPGLAPTSGFDDYIFEKKLDIYLAERGLIDAHQEERHERGQSVVKIVN